MDVYVYHYCRERGLSRRSRIDDVKEVLDALAALAFAQDSAIHFLCDGFTRVLTKHTTENEIVDLAARIVDHYEHLIEDETEAG